MKQPGTVIGLAAMMAILAGTAASAADVRVVCKNDYRLLCNNVTPGQGHITECFRDQFKNLSPRCKEAILEIKKEHDEANAAAIARGEPVHEPDINTMP